MPSLRALLLLSVSLLLLLSAGLLAAPGFIDWRAAKPRLEAELSRALGREVAVDGDFSLYFLPRPWVKADGLRVANLPQGSEPELLRVASLEMRLALWPLLSGHFEVESLRLLRPVLLLERLGDGKGNWNGMSTGRLAEPDSAASVSLANVELYDGELVWRDHLAGREERLSSLDGRFSADSLRGPLAGDGHFTYQGESFSFDMALAAPDGRDQQALRLQLLLPEAAMAEVRLRGYFSADQEARRFDGRVALSAPDAAAIVNAVTGTKAAGLDLARELTARSAITWRPGEVSLEGLEVDIADSRLEGRAQLWPGGGKVFDVDLVARFLNLDPLLEPGRLEWPGLSLPPQLSGSLALEVERLLWRAQSLKEFELAAQLEEGILLIDHLGLSLPGGGAIAADGRLGLNERFQQFQGHLSAETPNLRAQLAWLGLNIDHLASDRLRRMAVQAAVEAGPGRLTLADLDMEVDRTKLSGQFDLNWTERPYLDLQLALDQLDLDSYLEPLNLQESGFFRQFDADLDLEAEDILIHGRHVRGLRLFGGLEQGLLQIDDLQIADLAGAGLALSGRVDTTAAEGLWLEDGRIGFDVADAGRFLRTFNRKTPPLLRHLGPVQAEGEVEASGKQARLRLKLSALEGEGDLGLELEAGDDGLSRISGQLDLRDIKLATLEKLLSEEDGERRERRLVLRFSGDGEELTHQSRLELADAFFELDGSLVAPASRTPELTGVLRLNHPQADRVAEFLLPEIASALSGELEMKAQLTATQDLLALDGLEGRAGELVFGGKVRRTAAPQEALALDVALGQVSGAAIAALFQEAVPAGSWRGDQSRWSRSPLDLRALEGPDLDLRLQIARLELAQGSLDDLALTLQRRQQAWRLERFEAAAGSGRIRAAGTATTDPAEGLSLAAQVSAEALPFWLLRPWLAPAAVTSGNWSTDVSARSAGLSVAGLVASLEGEGELEGSFTIGEVQPNGTTQTSLLPALLADLDVRQLWFAGQLAAEEGRIKTDDLQLVGKDRRLLAAGVLANLPLRRADLELLLFEQESREPLKEMEVSGHLGSLRLRSRQGINGSAAPSLREQSLPDAAVSDAAALPHGP